MVIYLEREFIDHMSFCMCDDFPLDSHSIAEHILLFCAQGKTHLTAAAPLSKNRTTQLCETYRLPRPSTPRRFAATHDTQRGTSRADIVFDTKNESSCKPVRRWSPRGVVIWLSEWLWHWVAVGCDSLGDCELLYWRSGLVGWDVLWRVGRRNLSRVGCERWWVF